jgi:hypothetical protein
VTLREWVEQQSGRVVTIPAGTVLRHEWFYFEDGQWTQKPRDWKDKPKEYRAITTTKDQRVEIRIDAGGLEDHALKALSNRRGLSRDGAVTIKRS